MQYDYSELLKRIYSRYYSQYRFAIALGLKSASSINAKLKGTSKLTTKDIEKWTELLEINPEEIKAYFYTPKIPSSFTWKYMKLEELKNEDELEKEVKKWLKQDAGYSVEEVKVSSSLIRQPFETSLVNKTNLYEIVLNEKEYEVWYCEVQSAAYKPFAFYTLVDKQTMIKSNDGQGSVYHNAEKKFVL